MSGRPSKAFQDGIWEYGIEGWAGRRATPVRCRNIQGKHLERCGWHSIGHHVQFGVRGVIKLHDTIIMVVVTFLLQMHRRVLEFFMRREDRHLTSHSKGLPEDAQHHEEHGQTTGHSVEIICGRVAPRPLWLLRNCWWRWPNRRRSSWLSLSNASFEAGSCHSIKSHESQLLAERFIHL